VGTRSTPYVRQSSVAAWARSPCHPCSDSESPRCGSTRRCAVHNRGGRLAQHAVVNALLLRRNMPTPGCAHLQHFAGDVLPFVDAAVVPNKVLFGHAVLYRRIMQVRVKHDNREGQHKDGVCATRASMDLRAPVISRRTAVPDQLINYRRPRTGAGELAWVGGVVAGRKPFHDAVDLLRLGRQHEAGQELPA